MKTSRTLMVPCWTHRSARTFLYVFAILVLSAASSSAQDPMGSPGWVVIPVEEYRTLHARAFPAEHEPEPPPVEATLSRVDYDLRINGELAVGHASLTVDVLKEGWVRVPVPSGLLVREARLDGKLVSLVSGSAGKGGTQLSAVFSHAGRSTLLFDIALSVASAAGEESLWLPQTASGVTRAAVQLPRQDLDLRVSGGLLAEESTSSAESRWVAYARGNEPLTLAWRRKTEDHRVSQPLRLRGSLTELVGLGEDSTSIYAEINLEVTQGLARQVRIQLPDNVTINQVMGAMVADWEMKPGELAVTFLEPVEQTTRFVINGETRLPRQGQMEVPIIHLLGTERETGGLAAEVLGAGEIKDFKTQGLENADPTDLGEIVSSRQSPSLIAFRFRSDSKAGRSLAVNVARYDQQAVLMANVEEVRYRVLVTEQGKTLVQAQYAVRNNQRNFVKIALPQGAVVWSASLSGKPVRPGKATDGSLLLPLEKTRAEEAPVFPVEIFYVVRGTSWAEKGKVALPLPSLDLPISRTGLVLYYPPLFRLTPEPGSFRTQNYEDPVSAALNPGRAVLLAKEEHLPSPAQRTQTFNLPPKAGAPDATGALVDEFRAKSVGGRAAGIVPIRVSFPAFGNSIFLVSELTGENQVPRAELTYQREKKAGVR